MFNYPHVVQWGLFYRRFVYLLNMPPEPFKLCNYAKADMRFIFEQLSDIYSRQEPEEGVNLRSATSRRGPGGGYGVLKCQNNTPGALAT